MELKDTVTVMLSEDYKDRFRAEYEQTNIRYKKLFRKLVKYKAGTLDFVPNCPYDILFEQLRYMGQYLMMLEVRAEIEGIKL